MIRASPTFSPFADPALRRRLIALGLFLGTLLLFARATGFGFLDYDDPDFVTANPHVTAGVTWDGLRWAFTSGGNAANWQPLTWLSYLLDAQLWGLDPRAFHAVNLFWHAINAALAFLVLQRLTGATRVSALAAALWAWHPLRVESVAWVAERKDVLSVFFALLALWAYTGYATARPRGRARTCYALALLAFALGLLCKAMLVALPGALLLLDFWPLRRTATTRLRRLLPEKLPFAALSVASCWITYTVQRDAGGLDSEFTFATRAGNAAVSLWRYLASLAWPFDLAACYPLHPWPALTVLIAVLALGVVTVLVVRQRQTRPWLLFGWAWFVGLLVPVLGFVQSGPQAMADRYTYLPSLGLLLAVLWTLREWRPFHPTRWATAAAVAILAACAARTWDQLAAWRDSRSLFEHALAVTPDNYLAHANIASTLINAGEYDDALRHAQAALALDPQYAPAHYKLGVAREKLGQPDAAMASYRTALRLRPDLALADDRLGVLLLRRGLVDEAAAHFAAAVRRQPDLADAWRGLGRAEAQATHWPAANAAFTRALQLHPADATLENEFANTLVAQQRPVEAADHYVRALLADPRFGEAHYNYANLLRETNHPRLAAAHYRRALALLPDDADIRFGLGVALEQLGDLAAAERAYLEALRLDPTHADAHYNLGALRFNAGQFAAAREQFTRALQSRPNFPAAQHALALIAEQSRDRPAAASASN